MRIREAKDHRDGAVSGWEGLVIGAIPLRIAMVLGGVLAVALAVIAWELTDPERHMPRVNLPKHVDANLPETGVENPVTAVLLTYRLVDTWLELAVLMLAMMGSLVLLQAADLRQFPNPPATAERPEVLQSLVGLFIPLMIVVGAYLLYQGADEPGGAFQAGALLAAAGVVARIAGVGCLHLIPGWILRSSYVAGVAFILLYGLLAMSQQRAFLEFEPAIAGAWIIAIEIVATVSIALALWSLYLGVYPTAGNAQ